MSNSNLFAVATSMVVAAWGCGGNSHDTPSSTPSNGPSNGSPMTPPSAADITDAGNGTPMLSTTIPSAASDAGIPMDAAATSLSDAQIATIVGTANGGEIVQAQEALKKAKNPKVLAFARHMVTDHAQAAKDLTDIQKKGKLDPAATDTSRQIEADGKAILASLQSSPAGADFERKYMDAQVAEHQQLLDALDTKLIVDAQNAELKTFLQKVREKVADHLRMAKEIRSADPSRTGP